MFLRPPHLQTPLVRLLVVLLTLAALVCAGCNNKSKETPSTVNFVNATEGATALSATFDGIPIASSIAANSASCAASVPSKDEGRVEISVAGSPTPIVTGRADVGSGDLTTLVAYGPAASPRFASMKTQSNGRLQHQVMVVLAAEPSSGYDLYRVPAATSSLAGEDKFATVANSPTRSTVSYFEPGKHDKLVVTAAGSKTPLLSRNIPESATDGNYVVVLSMDGAPSSRIVNAGACALAIEPASLAAGEVGVEYDQPVLSLGSKPEGVRVVWTVTGALPPGLEFIKNTPDSLITGTPTTPGTFNFTVSATDGTQTATRAYSIVITGVDTTGERVRVVNASVTAGNSTITSRIAGTSFGAVPFGAASAYVRKPSDSYVITSTNAAGASLESTPADLAVGLDHTVVLVSDTTGSADLQRIQTYRNPSDPPLVGKGELMLVRGVPGARTFDIHLRPADEPLTGSVPLSSGESTLTWFTTQVSPGTYDISVTDPESTTAIVRQRVTIAVGDRKTAIYVLRASGAPEVILLNQ